MCVVQVMIMRIPTMISGIVLALTLLAQRTEVMIMRLPTMISGIVLALTLRAQLPHYTNVATREWFVGGLGLLVVIANMVLIFFAAVHCPAHMVIDGAVVSNDCSTWY